MCFSPTRTIAMSDSAAPGPRKESEVQQDGPWYRTVVSDDLVLRLWRPPAGGEREPGIVAVDTESGERAWTEQVGG